MHEERKTTNEIKKTTGDNETKALVIRACTFATLGYLELAHPEADDKNALAVDTREAPKDVLGAAS